MFTFVGYLNHYSIPWDREEWKEDHAYWRDENAAISDMEAEELVHFHRSRDLVDGSRIAVARARQALCTSRHVNITDRFASTTLRINCSNGVLIPTLSRGTLMRQFQTINDLIGEYPDVDEIDLPATISVAKRVLNHRPLISMQQIDLMQVLDLLLFLNPYNNLLALHYDLSNVTSSALTTLHQRMSSRERTILTQHIRKMRLPGSPGDVFCLIPLLEKRGRMDLVEEMLSDYPSYLFSEFEDSPPSNESSAHSRRLRLLLTADFNDVDQSRPAPWSELPIRSSRAINRMMVDVVIPAVTSKRISEEELDCIVDMIVGRRALPYNVPFNYENSMDYITIATATSGYRPRPVFPSASSLIQVINEDKIRLNPREIVTADTVEKTPWELI